MRLLSLIDFAAEGRTPLWNALHHVAKCETRADGLAYILQQQVASLDAGLHKLNGFREKEACPENKMGRIISTAKGNAKWGQLQTHLVSKRGKKRELKHEYGTLHRGYLSDCLENRLHVSLV